MPGERGRQPKALAGELPPALEWRWTVGQIATFHQLTPAAIIAAIGRGELRAEQSGKEYRVPDSWYREWVRESRVPNGTSESGGVPGRASFFPRRDKAA